MSTRQPNGSLLNDEDTAAVARVLYAIRQRRRAAALAEQQAVAGTRHPSPRAGVTVPEHERDRPGERAATPLELEGKPESTPSPPRVIHDELVITHDPHLGRVAHVLPMVPEHAPYAIREGITRRRTAALTGTCPCGATVQDGDVMRCAHRQGCPGATEVMVRAIRRWVR